MRIAVVGCGAVGSYYGARLARAGHETHFLLRSDYEVVRRRGVKVLSAEGDFTVRPRAARTPEEIGRAELVVIALKTTANSELPRLLPPLVGPETAVLTLQNGLGNEAAIAALLPGEQVLGGLCFVCLYRDEPGIIRHVAHGKIVLGEFRRWPEPRTHALARALRDSGVPCDVTDNLARAHWEKLVWNIPFNGLGVASAAGLAAVQRGALDATGPLGPNLTTDQLLADSGWTALVRALMLEVIAAANGLGYTISAEYAEHQIRRTRDMGAYRASTLIDYERGQPLELESLFLEPLRQAQAAGIVAPHLQALCQVLVALTRDISPTAGDSPSAPGMRP